MKPETNPYLPRVNTDRLINLLDVGHNAPAPTIVTAPTRMGTAGDFRFPDADRDGVPDLFDCAPLDPAADGWLGDAYKRAQSFFRVDYARAASRRASVRRAVSGGARAAASVVRRVPARPSQVVTRHIARHITRAAAPVVKRIVSRPSPAQIKQVTAAAFPKTTAMLTGAAALKKGFVAAKPTFEAVVTRTKEMIREPPYKVEAQARTERQKYEQMVTAYEAKHPDPSKPLPEQQKYQEMADAYRAKSYDPSSPLPDAEYKQAMAEHQSLMKQQMRMESEYERVAGDYQAIQEQRQIMDTAYEKTVSAGAERYLEEHQAIAPTMSEETRWIAKQTGRVAKVARGFEEPVEEKMLSIEERLGLHSKWIPAPVKTVGWGVKELGYGMAFTGTSAAVEMAGMIPGGVEVMAKKPSIIAPAAIYGTYLMGKGAWQSVTKSPTRFAGELITFGALMKGGEIALKPVTPTIIHGEGYVGVGIKGFRKPTYKTVEVKVTPKEFLKHEQAMGRIAKISHKPFTDRPVGESPLGTARIDVGEPMAITKPTQIFISPKTYGYSALRKYAQFVDPYLRWRGVDIYQKRAFRAKYPTREEVLAHELIHHKYPEFPEGKVKRMTREFGEIPSKKIFTIPKQVKTGYIREPIPFVGVRTKSGIPPIEGVTATYRGLQIGRRWTPAEYYKAVKIDTITTPEGTLFEARGGTQVRLGKLRYEKEAVARGAMEGGYFLPEAKAPIKPAFPEITTAEKGIIPLEPGKFPLSVDVVTPKALKPTRFYGEIRRPYAKAGEAQLFGSEARMRWTELGERRLIYGIEGAPKQPKITLTAERWGYHPTYPTGITGEAIAPGYFKGYTPPKQIPSDMYFVTEGVPASSRFFDISHFLRPAKPKPVETPPIKPVDRGIGAVTPRVRSEGIAPIPELKPEAPTVCVGGVCYRDVGVPLPQRVQPTPAKAQVPYAEPPKPDPTLQKILGEVGKVERKPAVVTKPKTTIEDIVGQVEPITKGKALTIERVKPHKRPRPDKRRKTGWGAYTPPSFEKKDVTAPSVPPFAGITPIHIAEEEDWRKTMPIHITEVETITDTVTEPYPYPETYPYPTPIPYPEPEPEAEPEPTPEPWGEWTVMPPPKKTPFPEPRIPKGKPPKEDVKRRRKVRGKREEYEWHLANPLVTLDEFFGNPPKSKTPTKPVNMIPTIPVGVI